MKIIFFSNGNVIAFDENGQQIPYLQCSWLRIYIEYMIQRRRQYGEDDIHDIENTEFIMPDGNIMIAENDGPDYIFKLKRD